MPNFQAIAAQAAKANGINPQYFVNQLRQESGFNPNARSGAGAEGIAQIVPHWHPDAPPASDPVGQIQWAAKYMAGLVRQHGGYAPALSVYNSGNVDAYKDPNFANGQTYRYVRNILGARASSAGGGSTIGPVPGAVTPADVGSTPTPLSPSPQQQQASIRKQAMSGFSDIAAGGSAEASFGHMAHFVNAMKMSLPQIHPATMAAAKADPTGLDAQAVKLAQKYIGIKYTWGGTDPSTGFDCSGLVQHVWGALGKSIPRTTFTQWDAGTPVANNDLRPGDAVFFTGSDAQGGKPGHEGLYIGQGKFIEAAHSGTTVHVSSLAGRTDYVGARRFA